METEVNVAIDSFIVLTLTDFLAGPAEPAGQQSVLLRQVHAAANADQKSASDMAALMLLLGLNFKIK